MCFCWCLLFVVCCSSCVVCCRVVCCSLSLLCVACCRVSLLRFVGRRVLLIVVRSLVLFVVSRCVLSVDCR